MRQTSGRAKSDLSNVHWSWVRLASGDLAIARGGNFVSLQECFASVRGHAARFGKAAVKVNLQQSNFDAPPTTAPSAAPLLPSVTPPRRSAPIARLPAVNRTG